MTTAKIFGSAAPNGTTDIDLLTVGAGKQAQVNVFVANRAEAADTFRIAAVPSGQSAASQHFLVYDAELPAKTSAVFSGICLNAGDKLIVRATNGTCSFTATGLEI